MTTNKQEHPFAQYIRILGKGKKGARSLTQEEASHAMQMILEDQVLPMQLGAFLMLLRIKEESAEEVAGFVQAVRTRIKTHSEVAVDLDWSSYAGKRRQLPWYLLSAFLLAQNGIRVCMHGADGHTEGRVYTSDVLRHLGIPMADSVDVAKQQLKDRHFCFLPLKSFAPKLQEIIEYRPLLGLRSPVHTVSRMLNPLRAPYSFEAIFHPGYQKIHQSAAQLLGDQNLCVFKGEGGEAEFNPDAGCTAHWMRGGALSEEEWPPLFTKRHIKEDSMNLDHLLRVWSGDLVHNYGQAAVIGTTALCLRLLGNVETQTAALDAATSMWESRRVSEIIPGISM